MKLYDYQGAPNPRRVKIFAAEKDIALELINVDMRKREHKTAEFMAKNPSGKIPVLELDDGTCISESVSICRYLEAIAPEPNLLGTNAVEIGLIDMHHRQIEFELLSQVGVSWVNGPIVAKMGMVEPIAAAKERSDALVNAFYKRLNTELANRPFIAGERFTLADITAVVTIDFATALVGLKPDEAHSHIWAWHKKVSARPSIAAE